LHQDGGREGDRVALRASGTHALAVGFVAISRAGMVSVPIDPTAPHDRVQTMLADVEPAVLLSDVEGDESLPAVPIGHPLTFGAEMDPVPIDQERGELVSIVFTSGSTGTPKGIMLGREQMDETFAMMPDFGIPLGSRLGGITAGTVSYVERLIGAALVLRGTLVSYEIRRHGLAPLGPWLERERIVAFATVPTVIRYLLPTLALEQRFPDLRTLVLSGETSTWEDISKLRNHLSSEATIVNAFGLTEAAGIASLFVTSDMPAGQGPLPAGRLSPRAQVTIINEDGEPAAPGERGEIVVEGPVCALGYWRRPDLTESVFRVMPSGHREVRTGDGGRFRSDGLLEHLGRLDHLVKISGNRVELGEVEDALMRLDGVAAAAAASYVDDTQSTRLTACVMPSPAADVDPRLLRAALTHRLPGYMIPDHIAVVEALPQLPGGKVDRARVAELRAEESETPAISAQASPLERSLMDIWSDILETNVVGVQESFFDLGGDSMRAARLFVEIERRLGIDRPMSLLAEAPTIASLALALADDGDWTSLLAVQTSGTRPPLFVIHDGTGSLLFARGLAARLGPDQPIYGIRCEGLNGQPPPERSLEELAATYIERIRTLYPRGPYFFYGVSLGGTIAMEMARQLKAAGEDVPLVALGDSTAPSAGGMHLTSSERRSVRRDELEQMDAATRVRHLAWLTRRQIAFRLRRTGQQARTERREERILVGALERGEAVPVAARGRYVMRQYGVMLLGYEPRGPFPERVLLLRTGGPDESPDRGWGTFVGDALQIVDVPGTHPDLGREASGSYVGPVLYEVLDELFPLLA
jgi:acyl-coenzyme A synthetase/AMP-(fatty) acid ligase/thioesterase domain-containing protein/acyl carrier protein